MAAHVNIFTFRIFQYFITFVLFSFAIQLIKAGETLYEPEDNIVLLNNSNFYEIVSSKDHNWFVEFYARWCGHCIRFKPTWKHLAQSISEWKPAMKLGAVNCADKSNTELCSHFDVKGYPTLRFFPHHVDLGHENFEKPFVGDTYSGLDRTYDELLKAVYKQIAIYEKPTNFAHVRGEYTGPKISLLYKMQDIWDEVTPDTQHTAIVVENDDTDIGKQLILDSSSMHPTLLIRRMHVDDVTKFGINKVPALYSIEKSGVFQPLAEKADYDTMVMAIRTLMGYQPEHDVHNEENNVEQSEHENIIAQPHPVAPVAAVQPEESMDQPVVYMLDLEMGLHYSLTQEIAMRNPIDGDDLDALKDFIHILAKYFPGRDHVVEYLNDIDTWLATQRGAITAEQWNTMLDTLKSDTSYITPPDDWIGCRGSEPHYRGYPCSVWSLFHVLTINAITHPSETQEDEELQELEPQEVLRAMTGYITQFFGCSECADNFNKMAVEIDYIETKEDAAMWLWGAHNRANKRLHGDASEDPRHPKVQFPTKQHCPECFIETTNDEGETVSSYSDSLVLDYLKEMYILDSIVVPEEDNVPRRFIAVVEPEPKHLPRQGENHNGDIHKGNSDENVVKFDQESSKEIVNEWKHSEIESAGKLMHNDWGFTSIDISLCVVFYFMSTVIIILIYYHFIVRRRMDFFSVCRKEKYGGKVGVV